MLAFLGLIFRKHILSKLKEYKKTNKIKKTVTLNVALEMLSDIECVKQDGKWILNKALTKDQKTLIECIGIPIYCLDPQSPKFTNI